MSWSNSGSSSNSGSPARRGLWSKGLRCAVLAAALAVAGCGYEPLYGRSSGGEQLSAELASVAVAPIPDRTGQMLRNALEQHLERAGERQDKKKYLLRVALAESVEELALLKDNTATRANLRMIASYTLTEGDRMVWQNQSESVVAYNILPQQYATVISQKDARERLVTQIAEDIARRLAVRLKTETGS